MCSRVPLAGLVAVLALAGAARGPTTAALAEAADGPVPAGAAPALQPGDIDVERSRIYVHVGKKKLGHEHAVAGRVKSGRLRLDAAKDAGVIEFDMAAFTADADDTRKVVGLKGEIAESTRAKVSETMRGPEVLDVEKHPTARFRIASSRLEKPEGQATVCTLSGRFTLRGETRDVKVRATPVRTDEGDWRLRGEFTLRQTDYGITPYRAFGVIGVADDLRIIGDLFIVGERAPAGK
jgi:polyisoprenoid-binding protein YceI